MLDHDRDGNARVQPYEPRRSVLLLPVVGWPPQPSCTLWQYRESSEPPPLEGGSDVPRESAVDRDRRPRGCARSRLAHLPRGLEEKAQLTRKSGPRFSTRWGRGRSGRSRGGTNGSQCSPEHIGRTTYVIHKHTGGLGMTKAKRKRPDNKGYEQTTGCVGATELSRLPAASRLKIVRRVLSVTRMSGPEGIQGAAHTRIGLPGDSAACVALTVRLSTRFDQTHNPPKSVGAALTLLIARGLDHHDHVG